MGVGGGVGWGLKVWRVRRGTGRAAAVVWAAGAAPHARCWPSTHCRQVWQLAGCNRRHLAHLAVCHTSCTVLPRSFNQAPRPVHLLGSSDVRRHYTCACPAAAGTVLSAFQPSVPLAALSGWFGFSKKKEAAAFLRERGAVVADGCLDIKQSRAAAARLAAAAAAAEEQQQEAAAQQQQLLGVLRR